MGSMHTRKWHERKCAICGEEFDTQSLNKKYCSQACLRKSYKIKRDAILAGKGELSSGNSYLRLRFEILKRDKFTCQYCGATPKDDGVKLHIDHIFPKSKGGLTVSENLITACKACNLGKLDVLLTERRLRHQN